VRYAQEEEEEEEEEEDIQKALIKM